jgi:RNA polymerase sigma-70 factor (ECF subfamily)
MHAADASSGAFDRPLVERAGRGDAHAFRLLMMRHLPKVVALARRMLGDADEAEDVAQEAMLRLWNHAATLQVTDAGIGGWLYRVASNLALDRIRARKPGGADDLDSLTVSAEQERGLSERELARRVEAALQSLPERQRLALVLCHYEEMSMAEAGGILGISVEAVESLLSRARRTLRAALEKEWRGLLLTDGRDAVEGDGDGEQR